MSEQGLKQEHDVHARRRASVCARRFALAALAFQALRIFVRARHRIFAENTNSGSL
jgi:hypothetical protein